MFPPHAGGGAPPMPAAPMQPPHPMGAGPVAGVFHNLAAHQLAPPMGHPPAPQMMPPGAPMPLMQSGRPPAPAGHMPGMMPR